MPMEGQNVEEHSVSTSLLWLALQSLSMTWLI